MNKDKFIINQIEGIVVVKKDGQARGESAKVMATIEEALLLSPIEWIE